MRGMLVVTVLVGCTVEAKHAPDGGGGPPDAAGVDANTDLRPPETMITAAPSAFDDDDSATFRFEADEPATFLCSIDGETPVACEPPYTRTLADGPHAFSVRAVDLDGNADETPAEHAWTIDTVAPQTEIVASPPALDNSVEVRFEFTSPEDGVTFDCSLDGATYAACVSGDLVGPLADGVHTFAVRAIDPAGNVDASPAIHTWTIDTASPDTTIASGPSGAITSTSATFTFYSPDAGTGATFQCALDGGSFSTCTSPRTYTGLADGTHTFAVRVRDGVGNLDPTPATRTWTVDRAAPDTSIVDGPSGVIASATATFVFAATETGATFECALDAGSFVACPAQHAVNGLSQGSHTIAVRAVDDAGNRDATPATRTWSVDTVPPGISLNGPADGATTGPYVVFEVTTSEGSLACSLDGAAFAACTSPVAFNLPAGAHTFAVRATDQAGNVTTVTRAFTVACSPPAAGATSIGLFHLDETTGQGLDNAAGGPDAVLGDDDAVEANDPAPLSPARFGGGLRFASADGDLVHWPAGVGALGDHTVELWVRPADDGPLLATADGSLVVALEGTRVAYSLRDGDGGTTTVRSQELAADAWHHVVASLARPTMRLWVDGVAAPSGTRDATVNAQDVLVGAGLDGDLDEIHVTSTAVATDAAARARYCPP